MKITQLDYALLGLINESPRSGYALRKVFETTALGNYSSSPGAIYPALRRLEKNNLIQSRKEEGSTKAKYFISNAGQSSLKDWFLEEPTREEVEKRLDLIILKFAFMEQLLATQEVLGFLSGLQKILQQVVTGYDAFYATKGEELPTHGRLAFKHGLMSYRSSLDWCETTLLEIKKLN